MKTTSRTLKRLLPATMLAVLLLSSSAYSLGIGSFDISRPDGKGGKSDASIRTNLRPGQTRRDRLFVTNKTDKPVKLYVYPADGVPARHGGVALRARLAKPRGVAKWIKMDAYAITLAPRETRTVNYTISIPKGSSSDEHIGGLVAERATALKSKGKGKIRINVLPRAAILVVQRVPGKLIEKMELLSFGKTWEADHIRFQFKLKNLSNVHQDPAAVINIYNYLGGGKTDTLKVSNLGTIFPQRTATLSAPWQKTPFVGFYRATARITYGKNHDKVLIRTMPVFIIPWWLILLVIAAIATFAWSVWEHSRQQGEQPPEVLNAPKPPGFPPASGQ